MDVQRANASTIEHSTNPHAVQVPKYLSRGWKIPDCSVSPTTETRPKTHWRYRLPDCQPAWELSYAPTIQPFEPTSHLLRAECVNQFGHSPDYLSNRKYLLSEDNDATMGSPLRDPSLVQWNEVANVISYQNTVRGTRRFQLRFIVNTA